MTHCDYSSFIAQLRLTINHLEINRTNHLSLHRAIYFLCKRQRLNEYEVKAKHKNYA